LQTRPINTLSDPRKALRRHPLDCQSDRRRPGGDWALGDHERDHTASARNAPSRRLAIENAITSAAAPRQGLALPLARGYGRDELRTVNDSWGDASCFDLRSAGFR
jgi:hypothetical protein